MVDPDTVFTHKQTILHMAATDGDLPSAAIMISLGANIESKTSLGRTALVLASIGNNYQMVDYLLLKGAKIDAQDNESNTALHHSA